MSRPAAYPRLTQPFAPSAVAGERQRVSAAAQAAAARLSAEYGADACDWFDADMDDVIRHVHASPHGLFSRLCAACEGLANSALFGLLQEKLGNQTATVESQETSMCVSRTVCFRTVGGEPTCLTAVTFPSYGDDGVLVGSRTLVAIIPRPAGELLWTSPAPAPTAPGASVVQSRETAAAELPDTLCAVPWLNLSLDVDGSVRPCCKFAHLYGAEGEAYGNLKTHTLTDVWHSSGMIQLRQQFRAGQKPAPCKTCWDEEAAGVRSYRQSFEVDRVGAVEIDFDNFRPERPITLDLKLSNRCNLKCRICGPLASSLFLSETLRARNDTPGYLTYLEQEQEYLQSNKITHHQANRDIFRRWLPEIQHIELFGGETTISEEVRELEELVIADGRAPHVSLLFNTNITVFSPEAVDRWRKFKRVTICLSLDDIGRRFEFQRSPARWEKVRDNALKYAAIQEPNFSICVFCSVSSYNILYLPEIVAWWRENCPQIGFVLNYVHYDPLFCVRHMPGSIKAVVRARLAAAADEIHAWEAAFVGRNTGHPPVAGQLREALAFLYQGVPEPDQWRAFLQRTADFDQLREESFAEVFPELWSLIAADAASAAAVSR